MSVKSKLLGAATTLTLLGGVGVAGVLSAGTAGAATPVVNETTHITNDPDSGGQGNWATDGLTRTLTITEDDGACGTIAASLTCWSASVGDDGGFVTLDEAYQPNQGSPLSDARITHVVAGKFTGTAGYLFTANETPSDTNVPATLSGSPGTSTWYQRAFPAGTTFGGTGLLNNWTWTYTTYTGRTRYAPAVACETWTDSAANGDGQQPADGNITGKVCPSVPAGRTYTGDVVNSNGKCLDAKGLFGVPAATTLQLWSCGAAGGKDQQFQYNTQARTLVYVAAGGTASSYCVTSAGFEKQAALALCDGSASQQVTYRYGIYQFASNSTVLDNAAFRTINGNLVKTWPANGGGNQKWSLPV